MIGERINTFQVTMTAQEVIALLGVLRNEKIQSVIAEQCSEDICAVLRELQILLANA